MMSPTIYPRMDSLELRSSTSADNHVAGSVVSIIVSLSSISILASFLTQRYLAVMNWGKLPLLVWVVFAIYIDSWLFVFVTGVLQHGLDLTSSFSICYGAILLCLVCYVTTKILIYFFLVEKAYIVRNTGKRRLESKLYKFNCFGVLAAYFVIAVFNFIFHITRLHDGQCIIGMKKVAIIPLISFDAVVNVYLTSLFLLPLRRLYTFNAVQRTPANVRLQNAAMRTFIGAALTTISSLVNLSVLAGLDGEPGWVCLMCCNCDILFSATIIHWVTYRDPAGTDSGTLAGASSTDPRNSLPRHTRDESLQGIKVTTTFDANVVTYPPESSSGSSTTKKWVERNSVFEIGCDEAAFGGRI